MNILKLVSLSTVLLISGCADGNHKPYVLDSHFGEAARSMARAQIANPYAADNPAPDSPRIMDGYAGGGVINSYRSGFSQNVGQNQGITVNIGSSTGGGGQ